MDPTDPLNASATPTGPSGATALNHSLVSASGERCPSCSSAVAADQRYCLRCGQRCGEPRLPFMNATTFMDTVKRPSQAQASPPTPKQRRRLSPNAALIAGVGTLLLAMGVGVLIGHSGNQTVATNASAPAQVITVPAGGGAATETTATNHGVSGGKGKSKKAAASAKKKAETGQGAEEVLKPSAGVKLPPANVQPGGKCESDAAGCENGKFTGNFFGE